MTPLTQKESKLFDFAEAQHGYFTSKQAESAGYLPTNFTYHVKTGAWVREERGLYRLKNFPFSRHDQHMHYQLWSRDRNDIAQGVYSFETALSLYELTDLNPNKLYMTVPEKFRKWATTPTILHLFYMNLPSTEIGAIEGLRVTTPIRTLYDIITVKRISPEFVEQAVVESLKRGLVRRRQIQNLAIPAEDKIKVEKWIKGSKNLTKAAG